jgi:hypothetical protein
MVGTRRHKRTNKRHSRTKRQYKGGEAHEMSSTDIMPSEMSGGRRRRHRHSSSCKHSKGKGGGLLATAAVPVGLYALQRYFKNKSDSGATRRRKFRFRKS